tara:strand:+ start:10334 stop:11077 length:744 start_codon:yes stop_codon:yes gene_type:complete
MNKENIKLASTEKKYFKYLNILSICYILPIMLAMIVENRINVVMGITFVSGTLIVPLSYTFSDMITEVYGYAEMKRLIWASTIIMNIVALLVFIILKVPTPDIHKDLIDNHAYQIVLSPFARDVFGYTVSAFVGLIINSYLLSKTKIKVKGKFFALRSLASSAIGEIIYILIFTLLVFYGDYPLGTLVELMLVAFAYKVICNIVLVIPSAMAVKKLKKIEGMDNQYDVGVNYNPFKVNGKNNSSHKN